MSAIQLLFTRRRHPGSALIRVTTWSAWSHVDLIDGESVLGAVAFRVQAVRAELFSLLTLAATFVVATLILNTARALAPMQCRSREQCFRMTRDVADTVRIMVDNLADPALLDLAEVRLWLNVVER